MGLSLRLKPARFEINRSQLQIRVNAAIKKSMREVGAKLTRKAQREMQRTNETDRQSRIAFTLESNGSTLFVSATDSTPDIMLRSGSRVRSDRTSDLRLRLLQRSGRLRGVDRELAPSEDISLREAVLRRVLERELENGGLIEPFKDSL